MSKKMLKRSLALGALMAFVITGSAMAKDIETQSDLDTALSNEVGKISDNVVAKSEDLSISNTYNKDKVIKVNQLYASTLRKIEISSDVSEFRVEANDDLKIGAWNSKHAIYASGVSDNINNGASIKIGSEENNLSKIFVSTPSNVTGVYSRWYSNVGLYADDIEISAGNRAVFVDQKGYIKIGALNNMGSKVTLKSSNASLGTVDGTSGSIEIYAKVINIENTAGGNAIYSSSRSGDDDTIKIIASDILDIKGDITAKATTSGSSCGLVINSDIDDALVRIEGDVYTYDNQSVTITLGKEGSYIKGSISDESEKSVLNMNPGTIWNVTGTSNINKVAGNQGILKVDETGNVLVKVTNGQDAKNFTLMGSKEASASLNGDDLAGELDNLAKTVSGINFASYEFEEGAALGAIEAYQENGVWKITERTNVTNSNISDVAALGLMAWRAENNDMNKRLGELRNANGEHGVWVRMVRGESEYNSVKNQYNTYQLGYDEKLSVDKSWTVGMALTYTDGESSFNGGNGENKHKGLAIYGSKLNNDGTFVDLIAKYARLDHDVEVGTEKGDYEANGYSVSAEYGKRFEQGNGLWIEPQVELTYGKVGSADYMIGKNRAVTHEGMESLVGRVGFSLGKDIKQGNVYARASYLYDFEGETEASYTDAIGNVRNINDDLGGGWWEVGVGANINLSKATYIYADVEKTFGGEVDTNWQWNLGVRYSF